jgi:hypothetical protein
LNTIFFFFFYFLWKVSNYHILHEIFNDLVMGRCRDGPWGGLLTKKSLFMHQMLWETTQHILLGDRRRMWAGVYHYSFNYIYIFSSFIHYFQIWWIGFNEWHSWSLSIIPIPDRPLVVSTVASKFIFCMPTARAFHLSRIFSYIHHKWVAPNNI